MLFGFLDQSIVQSRENCHLMVAMHLGLQKTICTRRDYAIRVVLKDFNWTGVVTEAFWSHNYRIVDILHPIVIVEVIQV